MNSKHYKHLEKAITEYFAGKGMSICIEAHGSRSGDLCGDRATVMAGEIKHTKELRRDLRGKFWKDWNSTQKFGGKTKEYRLNDDLKLNEDQFDAKVLSWVAVIMGQLNHYRKQQHLFVGWLVFEDYDEFYRLLEDALHLLRDYGHIASYALDKYENLGFCEVGFE